MGSSLILSSLALFLLVSLLIRVLYLSRNTCKLNIIKKKTTPLPPSPPSLPILGHLHHFKKPLHRSLARLSSLHSSPALPLLLQFASRPVVIVSSLSLAEECFTKNDLAFACRPQLPSAKSVTYNYSTLASAPYGLHWRNTRRMATVELLSTARLNSLAGLRRDEVRSLIKNLFVESEECEFALREVELKPRLFGVAFNVMMRMIAGKRGSVEDEERFRGTMEELLAMLGASNLSDFFPLLRVFDVGGVKKKMKRGEVKMDSMLQSLIDEKRIKRKEEGEDTKNNNKKKKGMLEVLMDLQEEAPEYYTDEKIKAMIVVSFIL